MEGATKAWTSPSSEPEAVLSAAGSSRVQKPLLTFGWRRITLYAVLLSILIIIFVNIGLTFWILTVLSFSGNGIGPIRIVPGGLELRGRALVSDQLVTSLISSPSDSPLTLLSYRNFTIRVLGSEGEIHSQLVFKRSGFEVMSNSFDIKNNQGRSLLAAEGGEIRLGADTLNVTGEGGIVVKTSLQTPLVRSEAGHDLELESPTRSMKIMAPQDITIESSARGITAKTHKDIHLISSVGSVQLDASNVYIHNLTSALPSSGPESSPPIKSNAIYQLCVCADGKLFLAPPDGICQTNPGDDVCR